MIVLQGQGVSGGLARGPLYFFRRPDKNVKKIITDDISAETERLMSAIKKSAEQLIALTEQCTEESGKAAAHMFEAHAMILEDEVYLGAIDQIMRDERCNAEFAVYEAGEQFAAMFAAMDDAYMRARAADVRDVTERILNNLTGTHEGGIDADVPIILAADDLTPSETLRLDHSKILGFLTREGSANSHAAILARTMGIPAICGIGDGLDDEYDGMEACIEGESGVIWLEPDSATLAEWENKYKIEEENKRQLEAVVEREDVAEDEGKIRITCNISFPEDVAAVRANGGQGIGLYRSEFLFLSSDHAPTEEEQFSAYRTVAEAMDGHRVVIRTLDIGADKQPAYFDLKKEENPAMGIRGIRFCLNNPEIFHTQLRAIYRASTYGKVAVMFPMITSAWEVRECRGICREVTEELETEGIPFDPDVEIGIMIETPAAVLIADELAEISDFFSVGTNDLTQYTLACDRERGDLGKFFDPRHPAVINAIKIAAEAAHRAGIWIGICGELAADPELLPAFIEMGIDELSVSPPSVMPLIEEIREYSVDSLGNH
ncbi:MAG: phosphoenolpyruvate--protein phosphotransferase [Clostridiales bacterium]|nr:phosphoenolpyruvate--protein phosphotransferase [Clostridiales bacterium]